MGFKNKDISLVVSNFDIGAGKKGAAEGALALMKTLADRGHTFAETLVLNNNGSFAEDAAHPYCKHITELTEAAVLLNDTIQSVAVKKHLPLILSGDHSNAIGALSGLSNANPGKRIGVIWIDAHADLHSPFTTPSGNMHGMPLAALSGTDNAEKRRNPVSDDEIQAWSRIKQLGNIESSAKISLRDLVFIGLRDAEPEEWHIVDAYNIKTFEPDSIQEHGIYYVINHTIEHLKNCDLIYVSFDADSLDPEISCGTGTPVENGLKQHEAEALFKAFIALPNLGAFEITEINPTLDAGGSPMAEVIAGLFEYGFKA